MAEKRPAKKAPAKKAPVRRTPQQQSQAAKRTAATKKLAAEQGRALVWAVQYGAPIALLDGWDPETGTWGEQSRVGRMLYRIGRGAHVTVAAKATDVREIADLISKGRQYMQDDTVSEDRARVPIDVRPFVDLALQVDQAEAEIEMSTVEIIYDGIKKDPRIGLTFLSRRFPERWAEQQLLSARFEYDPRDAAVSELLSDPNVASQMAGFARRAEAAAAGDDEID